MKTAFMATLVPLLIAFIPLGTGAHWAVSRFLGLQVKSVNLFKGGPIVHFWIWGTEVRIGYLPVSGSMECDPEELKNSPVWVLLIASLASTAICLELAFIFLGWTDLWRHFVSGFGQLYEGALHPKRPEFIWLPNWRACFQPLFRR